MPKHELPIKPEIINCEDGSKTLYRKDLNEHYHSTFGAYSESMHIFIDAGFKFLSRSKTQLNILEIGFGTGLNAFLTYFAAKESKTFIRYTGIEKYKLGSDLLQQMSYDNFVDDKSSREIMHKISDVKWDEWHEFGTNFHLLKMESAIEELNLNMGIYDLVYFDAFAPDVQAELWTADIFNKIFYSMSKGAVLVTYSCKGDVKRALKSVGFKIEKLPGPKGKREFLRAIK